MNTVGFTGTREGMTDAQGERVMQLLALNEFTLVHHGCCIGADEQFHKMCLLLKVPIIGHPPSDQRLMMEIKASEFTFLDRPHDYIARNKIIVRDSQLILATPKQEATDGRAEPVSGGTWRTINIARGRERPLCIVYPSGRTRVEGRRNGEWKVPQ